MKTNSLFGLAVLALFSLGAVACDGDDDTNSVTPTPVQDSGSTADVVVPSTPDAGSDSGTIPAPPALGTQIDRFGRPAVNTALNHTFDGNATAADMAKDMYNANGNASAWVAAYQAEVAANLAILDSLDTVCGNQSFAKAGAPAADTYATLAGVLADDRMWLNTASTTCTTYLGVELNATGASPNTDCGGRKLGYDVIDATYGVVSGAAGFGDTIAAVPAKTNGTTFPYLGAPL